MTLRRIVYAAALLGAVVFYWAYREWLSWLVLMLLVFLPWFSLLLSLPAMLFSAPPCLPNAERQPSTNTTSLIK